jgi:zinc protease
VASNAVIALVGDVNRSEAEKIAERLTTGLDGGHPAKAIADPAAIAKASMQHIKHPSAQSHILMGHPGMRRGDKDYFALYVGNHALGGGGLVSKLSDEIREKRGLSYSVYSYFSPMRVEGPFTMGLQTRNDQVGEALEVMQKTLRDYIDKGITKKQLQASKKNIIGGFPLRIDSNKKIVEYLAMIGFYNLPLDHLKTFTSKVEAVTVKDIRDAFKRRVHPDAMVTIVVGNGKELGKNSKK